MSGRLNIRLWLSSLAVVALLAVSCGGGGSEDVFAGFDPGDETTTTQVVEPEPTEAPEPTEEPTPVDPLAGDLAGADLSGLDLSGADLFGRDLSGADLSGSTLTGADLDYADLRDAVLDGAVLRDATLIEVMAESASFVGADLTDADLRGAVMTGADLTGADLTRAVLDVAFLVGVDLTRADLTDASLVDVDLSDAVLTNVVFTGATLDGAWLIGATVDVAALDAAASLVGVTLQTFDEIAAALAGVPSGAGIPDATPYAGGPTPHPIVVFSASGDVALMAELPEDWLPLTVQDAQLVAVVGDSVQTVIEVCPYNGPDITRYRYSQTISLYDVTSGGVVASVTLSGDDPRECRQLEPYDLVELHGEQVSSAAIIAWLEQYVVT